RLTCHRLVAGAADRAQRQDEALGVFLGVVASRLGRRLGGTCPAGQGRDVRPQRLHLGGGVEADAVAVLDQLRDRRQHGGGVCSERLVIGDTDQQVVGHRNVGGGVGEVE